MPSDTHLFAFYGFIAAVLIETVLSARWIRAYFRSGFLVYSKRISPAGIATVLPGPSTLESAVRSTWLPSLVFRQLSPTELAFRERLFEFRLFSYTPLMHGLIECRVADHQILVQGRLNWSTVLFTLFFAVGPAREAWLVFLPFLAGVLAVIYALQAYRYRRVVAALASASGAPA